MEMDSKSKTWALPISLPQPAPWAASPPLSALPTQPQLLPGNLSSHKLEAEDLSILPTVSKADCYVQLWLPSASPSPARTRVVANCRDPEWNETFHYRIHGAVKVGAGLRRGRSLPRCLPSAPSQFPPFTTVPRMSWSSPSMTRTSWRMTSSPCCCLI